MGCRTSKNESENTEGTMSRHDSNAIDYKARLERKMCLAKETPEPEFDLSNCMLKAVPTGVFINCRVLRKELLDLSNNRLPNLKGGGDILDLTLLQSLNLNENLFKKLPDDIHKLTNLRELFISKNQLETIPNNINQLNNLELLDVSYNKLEKINSINCMAHLRILNISENKKLTTLPKELSTCQSLVDLILDTDTIHDPPSNILDRGTIDILNYLSSGYVPDDVVDASNKDSATRQRSTMPSKRRDDSENRVKQDRAIRERILEEERLALADNFNKEAQLRIENEKRKQLLLQQLIQQQNENDSLVNKIQQEKDLERSKFLTDILNAEEQTNELVQKLNRLKNSTDVALLEQECRQEAKLLEQLSIEHKDLRKQEILSAMSNILADEMKSIQNYQEQRDASARQYLMKEQESDALLQRVFKDNDKDRATLTVEIMQNEELQKSAVTSLITKHDARSWGLIEQVRIVESQLASLTNFEIERRKLCNDETMVNLSEQRVNLTHVLLNLLSQQEERKEQLLNTLMGMENQKQENEEDFWLLQYQKLWDLQPTKLMTTTASIVPLLGYKFLINGVVHCIPHLSKIWQNKQVEPLTITDNDLFECGIINLSDRENILKSIQEYVSDNLEKEQTPSAPPPELLDSAIEETSEFSPRKSNKFEMLSECVICMEEQCKIVFIPCGHLCCCLNCNQSVELCPLCRTAIENRIKVIPA